MDASTHLEALVAPLRADVLSGAARIAGKAADIMAGAAREARAADTKALREAVARVGMAVLDAQPAMAPLVALVGGVLDAMDPVSDVEGARRAAMSAAQAFRAGLEARGAELAARAAALLPERGDVLTLSFSSAVRDTLLHGPPGEGPSRERRAVVLESRPLNEGRALAEELSRAGVPVLYAVDAAAAELAATSAAVLLGADSIGDAGVVNKLGSRAVVDASARAGVPVLVVADGTKILPPGLPQHLADDRPAADVWEPPPGVAVWNRYFEAVPLEAVTRVITASRTLTPAEVETLRRGRSVPEEVRRWADRRRRGHPETPSP